MLFFVVVVVIVVVVVSCSLQQGREYFHFLIMLSLT